MSKNNFQERLRKMQPKQNRYAIRKFTVGVASVLIGISFLSLAGGQTVHADVNGQQPQVEQIETEKEAQTDANGQDNKETVAPVKSEQLIQSASDQASLDKADQKQSFAPKVENKISAAKGDQTKSVNKTDLSRDHNQADAPAEQKNVQPKVEQAAPNKVETDDKQELNQAKPEPATKAEQGQKDDDQDYNVINVGKLSESDQSRLADLLGVSLREVPLGNIIFQPQFGINSYHKTNDGSSEDPEITTQKPKIIKITWTNDAAPGQKLVYELQSNGSYLLTKGAGIEDANGDPAPAIIPAGQVIVSWQEGHKPDSNAAKFPKSGTGTSLATLDLTSAHGVLRGDQWDDMSEPREVLVYSLGPIAQRIFSNILTNPYGIYSNYYGAIATNTNPSFKQNQDLAHLSQADFRKMVDVTDLGRGGWNGVNVDPDAPITLAYVPGTDNSKKFWMTWAPGKEPSTVALANDVAGTVRIHFNDGTWLDVPVKIDVKNENNGGSDQPTNPNPTPNPNPQPTNPMPTPAPQPTAQPTAPNNGGQKNNSNDSNVKPKAAKTVNKKQTNKVVKKAGKKLSKAAPSFAGNKCKNGFGQGALNKGKQETTTCPEITQNPNKVSASEQNNSNGNGEGNDNGQNAKTLPQTGAAQKKDGVFSVIGLALASLAILFILGDNRKRDNW